MPLLRLRIEHESDQQFSSSSRDLNMMLGLEKRVANPDEVVKLARKRSAQEKIEPGVDEEAWDAVFNMEVLFPLILFSFWPFKSGFANLQSINMVEGHLENLLVEYYAESNRQRLSVMHERTLAEGVRYYVEKNHDDAFRDLV